MNSTLSTRHFELNDARPLTDLLHAAYAELGSMGLNFTAVDQSVETTVMRALAGQCWIVEDKERLVGTLTMSFPPLPDLRELTSEAEVPQRAWLNQVAVSPAARGQGIAAHLWAEGKKWALAHGATSVGVDTALPAAHLVELYSAWGFTHTDSIRHPGKVYDSAVMVLQLSNLHA